MDSKVNDKNFQNAWYSGYVAKPSEGLTASEALTDVRNFAYAAFERLDKNGNGFIEMSELKQILQNGKLTERESSFVYFLLNNHQQISDSFAEEGASQNGISRQDLNAYFNLILQLL